ncbi:MAG: asparagine synthase [Labilithrix sp.]|nr:asparagine synthase [Labilithrix sp.]
MTVLAYRDALGARRILFDPVSGAHADDLRSLLAIVPSARDGALDPLGIDAAWGRTDAPGRTCLRAVHAVPPGMTLVRDHAGESARVRVAPSPPPSSASSSNDLAATLVDATARALAGAVRPIVALGGGLDAALSVLAARRAGASVTQAIHLSLPGTTYDESAGAHALASALGLELHDVAISTGDLANELPRAVALAETPLYNLHPVARAVVARVAKERGHDVLVTGDGADQAARGATERADYVPVVAAMTTGSGVALGSPFLDEAMVALLSTRGDPGKQRLRELAVAWGLPRSLADRPKVPCSAPPLPREAFPDARSLESLATSLGRALSWSADDRANVGIASLAAFAAAFGAI